jgi:hypothetical protein
LIISVPENDSRNRLYTSKLTFGFSRPEWVQHTSQGMDPPIVSSGQGIDARVSLEEILLHVCRPRNKCYHSNPCVS